MEQERLQVGMGTGRPGAGIIRPTVNNLTLPAEVKSKTALYEWLEKQNLTPQQFDEAFERLGPSLPLRTL